jgi:NTE family protein
VKRQVIGSFKSEERKGTYWSVRSDIVDYGLADVLPCPAEQTLALAEYPTRLAKVPDMMQERLINWGYAICDAAMRRHVVENADSPQWPYARAI